MNMPFDVYMNIIKDISKELNLSLDNNIKKNSHSL